MDKETRSKIERATQRARKLLEQEFTAQLEGTFDIMRSGDIPKQGGAHLSPREQLVRAKIVAAVQHKRAAGIKDTDAVADYLRDAAFTTLNRFVALKMLEARELLQECISRGDQSSGFREFCGMAPAIPVLPDGRGYRLYLECLCDELSQEVKVLFDRRDMAALLWPRRQALQELLEILNASDLAAVWREDETIGWVYQYFNSGEERREMRGESRAPRNCRELAIRNQFFTPRYVVEFLTDNTLGRIWYEMRGGDTVLRERCRYLVWQPVEVFLKAGEHPPATAEQRESRSQEAASRDTVYIRHRPKKDPRDLRVLDPACGSGHFLLYAFDLLLTIYEEGWGDEFAPCSQVTGRSLRQDYPEPTAGRKAFPALILAHNLYGIDIDPRCAQIAALALWLRAQREYQEKSLLRALRPLITRTNIVVAEPMPGDGDLVEEFARGLQPPVLGSLFKKIVKEMLLAGELGYLLKIEQQIQNALQEAEQKTRQGNFRASGIQMVGIDFWSMSEPNLMAALQRYAEEASIARSTRRRLFVEDAVSGAALIHLLRQKYDSVVMNPPFGDSSTIGKLALEDMYPKTKNDIFAAMVQRGIEVTEQFGYVGAITSRNGFFLSSFQKWREEVLLKLTRPVLFADLGWGVLDSAMVETAAYCLEVI